LKKGFGIITAIIVVAAISGIGILLLTLSSSRVKKSTDEYLQIQAELLAQSATEYAIMRIEGFDRSSGNCLKSIDIKASPFQINVSIRYFLTPSASALLFQCTDTIINNDPNANNTVLIDVNVKTALRLDSQENISFHKRTLQQF